MQFAFAPEDIGISPLTDDISYRLNCQPTDHYRNELLQHINQVNENSSLSILQQITRLDLYSYLPDDVLVKVDRASMLNSLEVRSPLLDYRIAEFAFRLPDRLRFKGGGRKYLLKKVARKYLPSDFPFERKQGFSIPEAEWFKEQWKAKINHVANSGGVLNLQNIKRIGDLHKRTGRCGRILFRAAMLAKWHAAYMEHGNAN
jgi:asparagine synthase (glutamine-hydrolysing)